nr:ABC transporter substrate-binding protein [Bradyrhizobium sp. dw_411]
MNPVRLDVNVFLAGFNWPLWVGQDKGFFAREGLDVRLEPTPGSIAQMSGLIDGRFDIAMTAIDNIVAYMEGQGEAETVAQPDLVAVMGADNGFLSLIVSPDIHHFSDLRGKALSVDALTTGYAFVLRKILAVNGLNEGDYQLVKVGGMRERFDALLAGKHVGTLSVPPYTFAAADKGFRILAVAADALDHYQGVVAAVRRGWADAHKGDIESFIRANIAALDWLYDRANKAEALRIFQAHLAGASPGDAERSYAVLLDGRTGFFRDAKIDAVGVRTVLALRSDYGVPRKHLSEPEKYSDMSFYETAVSQTKV